MKRVNYIVAGLALSLVGPLLRAQESPPPPAQAAPGRERANMDERERRQQERLNQMDRRLDRLEKMLADRARPEAPPQERQRAQMTEDPVLQRLLQLRERELSDSGANRPGNDGRQGPEFQGPQEKRPLPSGDRNITPPRREPGWQPEQGRQPEQRPQPMEALAQARERGRDLMVKLQHTRQELQKTVEQPDVNEAAVRELAMQIGRIESELALVRAKMAIEMRNRLGPERFEQWRQARPGFRGPPPGDRPFPPGRQFRGDRAPEGRNFDRPAPPLW